MPHDDWTINDVITASRMNSLQIYKVWLKQATPELRLNGTEASAKDSRIVEDAGKWKYQENTGTEDSPTWTTRVEVDIATGAISKPRIKDEDATPVGDLILRVIDEVLQIRNAGDTAFKFLAPQSGGIGADISGIAKGGLLVGSGAGAVGVEPGGATDGHVLKVKAANARGVEWAAATGFPTFSTGSDSAIPASPAVNNAWLLVKRALLFVYDGANWVNVNTSPRDYKECQHASGHGWNFENNFNDEGTDYQPENGKVPLVTGGNSPPTLSTAQAKIDTYSMKGAGSGTGQNGRAEDTTLATFLDTMRTLYTAGLTASYWAWFNNANDDTFDGVWGKQNVGSPLEQIEGYLYPQTGQNGESVNFTVSVNGTNYTITSAIKAKSTWWHIIMTISAAGAMELFIDNVSIGTANAGNLPANGTAQNFILANRSGITDWALRTQTHIDAFKLYPRVISSADRATIKAATKF